MSGHTRGSQPSSWASVSSISVSGSSRSHLLVDGERVKYVGPGNADKDAASVRADHPVPTGSTLFYFEIEVIERGRNGYVGLGFSAPTVALNRLPGWEEYSYGYHGDDGHAFHESGRGESYGPKFGKGDIIGALLNRIEGTISFTKNGADLGVAFSEVDDEVLYPTVGLRTPDEEIVANFGSRPFKTDFSKMQADVAERLKLAISSEDPLKLAKSCRRSSMEAIVMEYLVEKGFWKTAQATSSESESAFDTISKKSLEDMQQRQNIQGSIISGSNQDAIRKMNEVFPAFLLSNSQLHFRLQRMVFMEMIQKGNTKEAIAFGKKILGPLAETDALRESLQEALTLLTVEKVQECPNYDNLLGRDARLKLASDTNSALLRHQGKPGLSLLEKSVRHVEQVKRELNRANNPAIQLVDFDDYLSFKTKTN